MKDLVLGNGDVMIRLSADLLAQKSDQEIRELVRFLYANYYRQPKPIDLLNQIDANQATS